MKITTCVNGISQSVEGVGDEPLLHVLRNVLGLRGVRFGCGQGLCGACTVLLDGRDVHACQISVSQAAGHEITTVEGLLDKDGGLGRVQKAIVDHRAGQCGYCLSGIVMRIEAGLREGVPHRAAMVTKLRGNLCRCGAHPRILRAVDQLLADRSSIK
jgi:nicotinate dehydrogenase subunit A